MAKQVQARSQKEIDEEFAAFAAENIKKDEGCSRGWPRRNHSLPIVAPH
jgi:hypothetical protein